MPRISVAGNLEDIPLTVAAVSVKIGVPASTLRTWERRYGLGPSARTMGSHRRYTAMDLARLDLMCKLIRQGYSPCDAASKVRVASLKELDLCGSVQFNADILQQASKNNDAALVQAILRKSVSELGLLKSWTKIFEPALTGLSQDYLPTSIGTLPYQFLSYEILRLLNRIKAEVAEIKKIPPVLLVSSLGGEIEATVIGVALEWENIPVQHINMPSNMALEALGKYLQTNLPSVVVLLHPAKAQVSAIVDLFNKEHIPLVVVKHKGTGVKLANATLLHSLSAALAEILAIID